MEKVITWLVACIGAIAIVILQALWSSYVFRTLWNWFIVTAFGVPALSLAAAMGVILVIGSTRTTLPRKNDEGFARTIAFMFLGPLGMLGVGYIVHLYL